MNYSCYKPFSERTFGEAKNCIEDRISNLFDYIATSWEHITKNVETATMSEWFTVITIAVVLIIFIYAVITTK
jgi:hypothetical protein